MSGNGRGGLYGSISQPELAQELRSVSVLAYANTFEETSCISVMEAMASGCQVVTSDLAALPETTAGYGQLVSVADVQGFSDVRDWRFSQRQDWKAYGKRFVQATLEVLQNYYGQETHLRQMVDYINESCTWDVRSHEWVDWLQELLTRNQPTNRNAPTSLQIFEQKFKQAEKFFLQKQLTDALEISQQLLQIQPDFAPGYNLLGNILQSQGKIQAAKRAYETAIALNPNLSTKFKKI